MSIIPGAGHRKKIPIKRKSIYQETKEVLKRITKRNPRMTDVQQY